jgi:hypothetical protein
MTIPTSPPKFGFMTQGQIKARYNISRRKLAKLLADLNISLGKNNRLIEPYNVERLVAYYERGVLLPELPPCPRA